MIDMRLRSLPGLRKIKDPISARYSVIWLKTECSSKRGLLPVHGGELLVNSSFVFLLLSGGLVCLHGGNLSCMFWSCVQPVR